MIGNSSGKARKAVFSVLVVLALFVVCGQSLVRAATFNVLDRSLLAEYRILGRDRVPLVLATQPVRTREVVKAIESLGGEIISRQDDIGYLYVSVKVDAAEAMEKIAGIDALEVASQPGRGWTELQEKGEPAPAGKSLAPGPFLAIDNPFTAEYVTQASQFKSANPTFDGRGVVIGTPEAADPSFPSMKGALDLRGLRVPKFLSYWWGQSERARPAKVEAGGNFWQYTEQINPGSSGSFTFAGRTYKLPLDVDAKEWRICARGLAKDKSPAEYGEIALWAVDRRQLWILTEGKVEFQKAETGRLTGSLSFITIRDDDLKRDENSRYRAWVFVVDENSRRLAFGKASSHAQMVASVMGGDGFLGSRAGGIAPASQIAAFVETGGRESDPVGAWETIESVFQAIRDPQVDIVQSALLAVDTAKGLDSRVVAILLDRLVRLTRKAAAVSVGNAGPSLTGIFGFSYSFEGFSIGGFTPHETWLANQGFEPSAKIALPAYSAWGPTTDGSLKPDFLALTGTLCERASSSVPAFERPFGIYTISGGTSGAAPHAAGHLALLISGARQRGLNYDWRRLRAAIATTAKFLPGVEARAQGYGLIQVADAFEALKRANTWEPPLIESSAIVLGRDTTEAGRQRGTGRGLFETVGWEPGMSSVRDITVVRKSGPAGRKVYRLRWKDNSDAFSSPMKEVDLPRGQPIKIPVEISVGEMGSYSAVLGLIDPDVELVAHSVLATILVSQPLNKQNGYRTLIRNTLDRPGSSVVFVNVPAGLSQLSMRMKREDAFDDLPKSGTDNWQLIVEDPIGRRLPYSLFRAPLGEGRESAPVKGEQVQVYPNPIPGVWQFFYEVRFPIARPSETKLRATGMTWEFAGYTVTSKGDLATKTVSFSNTGLSALNAKVIALGLGSERESDLEIEPGLKPTLVELKVADGTKRIEIDLMNDDPKSLVGLYIYKIPDHSDKSPDDLGGANYNPALVYYDSSGLARKRWTVDDPKPGKYVVAIDPLSIPATGLKVHYRELIVNPAYGELLCADNESVIAPGAEKSAKLSWAIVAKPTGDRKLVAVAGLISRAFGYSKLSGTRGTSSEKIQIVPVALSTQTIVILPASRE